MLTHVKVHQHNQYFKNEVIMYYIILCCVDVYVGYRDQLSQGCYMPIKAGSQYDARLALCQLRCDKILKTDWSNATQLTQR